MYGVKKNKGYEYTLEELIKRLDINLLIDKPVRELSLGQRIRCEFVAAFLHSPEIVFLDEPTIGLDFYSKNIINNFIQDMNQKKGVTVIYTSHDLIEVEKITNRLIVINSGKIVFDGNAKKLRRLYRYNKKMIIIVNDIVDKYLVDKMFNHLDPNNYEIKYSLNKISLRFNTKEISIKSILNHIGFLDNILDISIIDTEIEQVVKWIYDNN